jgi:N-acetylglucosaminyldiphosphoundecaprenol N-acetyl-beta-D-mannosaminyltransferase
MQETLARIDELVDLGRNLGRTYQVSTVNVDFLVNALDDPGVASILQGADLCLADGMPVVWGARMLGMPIRERVAGSDLVPAMIDATRSTGRHVHLFGSSPAVADAARTLLGERYPGANFTIDPGPMMADVRDLDSSVLDAIAKLDPDILCVALGNPKQERFIATHRDRLRTPVMIGIGGSLDMLVGKRRRAPTWVQRIGMEWVVRAVQEPKRLGVRYAHDIRVFGPALARAWRAARARRNHAGLELGWTDNEVVASFRGVDVASDDQWARAAASLANGYSLSISVADPPRDRAVAQMVGLVREARCLARSISASPAIHEATCAALTELRVPLNMLGIKRSE